MPGNQNHFDCLTTTQLARKERRTTRANNVSSELSLFLFAIIKALNDHFSTLDHMTIVRRHCPSLYSINTSEVAVLGNGAFALSVDVTGL